MNRVPIEDATLSVCPADPDDLYNITKLAGEAVSLALLARTVVSLVCPMRWHPASTSANFLPAVLTDARRLGTEPFTLRQIRQRTMSQSTKW